MSTGAAAATNPKSQRSSNIELLRIIAMLAIIMHHYVVHSGIENLYDYQTLPANMALYQICGMLGKTMVNVFPLITGYYMCEKTLHISRYLKVYLEVKFYRILIYIILAAAGIEVVTAGKIFGTLFSVLQTAGNDFASSFLVFYLFIPFYNRLLNNLKQGEHCFLVCALLVVYTLGSTVFFNYGIFSEVPWYMVLYFVAAYLRRYPQKWQENRRLTGCGTLALLVLDACSILVLDHVADQRNITPYFFLYNANKLLAFLTALFLFLFFLNLNIPYNKGINTVAGAAFGVFLIHDNSAAMRTWLWQKCLQVTKWYGVPTAQAFGVLLATALGIYVVCCLLDLLRKYLLEKPVFEWIMKEEAAWEAAISERILK